MPKNKGNTFIISILIIAIILVIFLLIIAIYIGTINSYIHDIKLDMYSINKSAIISVNKGITSRGLFSYNTKEYKKNFEDMLKKNYDLDDNLVNSNGLIQKVEIVEYNIYDRRKRDSYTKKKIEDTTIHSIIKVYVKPIFLEEILKDTCTFYVHEDVVLNKVIGA